MTTISRIQNIKGTHDLLPEDTVKWQFVEKRIHEFLQLHGYAEIRTPAFETSDLFIRGIGGDTDVVSKEMYRWTDQGGNDLTLKPELTAPVVRAFIQHQLGRKSAVNRLYYLDSLFRRERPQKGRQRQFNQFGLEAFGSPHPEMDAEVISIAYNFYKEFAIKDLSLKINSIGSPDIRKPYLESLKSALNSVTDDLCKTCNYRLGKNALRIFDCKNPSCQKILDDNAPFISDFLAGDDQDHFSSVLAMLDCLDIPYTHDKKLVRGLDYYTHTTFEITSSALGSQDALCGGGRYNKLVEQLGGDPVSAIGFAAGMERLLLALEVLVIENNSDIYLVLLGEKVLRQGSKLAQSLRLDAGYSVVVETGRRAMKAQMKDANRKKVKWALLLGENEFDAGCVQIKNMATGKQEDVPFDKIISYLKDNPG